MITWSTRCGWSQRALSSNAALLSSRDFLQPTRIERFRWNDIFWTLFDQLFTVKKRPIRYNILIDLIIKVRMKFGDTEIKATALDLATGQVPQITNHHSTVLIQCSLPIFLTVLIYESQTRRFSSRFFIFPFSRRCTLPWTSSQTPIQSTAPSSELIWVPSS